MPKPWLYAGYLPGYLTKKAIIKMAEDTLFVRRGNDFFMRSGLPAEHKELPPGTYHVKLCPERGLYVSAMEDITAPGKLYGSVQKRAERVLSSFMSRPGITTGVLLTGTKGTGKTLLSKHVIERARLKHKVATLVISAPFHGPGFLEWLNNISQPLVVLIDEAEKVYSEPEHQQGLLQLLDGVYSSHKLFILAVNHNTLADTLQNRPGRLHYRWTYNRLEREVIQQYAQDTLKNQQHLRGLTRMMEQVQFCTFDVLKGLVWEMNQYNESAEEAITNLNIDYHGATHYVGTVRAIAGPCQGRQWQSGVQLNGSQVRCAVKINLFDYNAITAEQLAVYNEVKLLLEQQHHLNVFGPQGAPGGPSSLVARKPLQPGAQIPQYMWLNGWEVDRVRDHLNAEQLALAQLMCEYEVIEFGEDDLVEENYTEGKLVYDNGTYVAEFKSDLRDCPSEGLPQPEPVAIPTMFDRQPPNTIMAMRAALNKGEGKNRWQV